MTAIKHVSITDAVVERIKDMICSGECVVGEKLPTESRLCEELQVSRTSVREAIRMLQAFGYVEIRPGRGAFVADYRGNKTRSWSDSEEAKFSDFMEVRMAIETLSVKLSVERCSAEQIKELMDIQRKFEVAYANQDAVRMTILDEHFHTKIVEFTKNQLLININERLLDSFRPYRNVSFSDCEVFKENAVKAHGKIVECFIARNQRQAEEAMMHHLHITMDDFNTICSNNQKRANTGALK